MNRFIRKVDELIEKLIEKIPGHIRDIIRKASYALLGIILLFAVTIGIRLGVKDAQPAGMQLSGSSRDLLYLQELREENQKRSQLFEDVETDPLQFPSRQKEAALPFAELGRDTGDRLLGERDALLENPDFLRPKEKGPAALEDEIFTPRLTPTDTREIKESETESLLPPREKPAERVAMPEVKTEPSLPAKPLNRPTQLDFLD